MLPPQKPSIDREHKMEVKFSPAMWSRSRQQTYLFIFFSCMVVYAPHSRSAISVLYRSPSYAAHKCPARTHEKPRQHKMCISCAHKQCATNGEMLEQNITYYAAGGKTMYVSHTTHRGGLPMNSKTPLRRAWAASMYMRHRAPQHNTYIHPHTVRVSPSQRKYTYIFSGRAVYGRPRDDRYMLMDRPGITASAAHQRRVVVKTARRAHFPGAMSVSSRRAASASSSRPRDAL